MIGETARVGARAEVEDAVLLPGAQVDEDARVVRSIVGSRGTIGKGAALVDSVLGEGARVPPGVTLEGVRLGVGDTLP